MVLLERERVGCSSKYNLNARQESKKKKRKKRLRRTLGNKLSKDGCLLFSLKTQKNANDHSMKKMKILASSVRTLLRRLQTLEASIIFWIVIKTILKLVKNHLELSKLINYGMSLYFMVIFIMNPQISSVSSLNWFDINYL